MFALDERRDDNAVLRDIQQFNKREDGISSGYTVEGKKELCTVVIVAKLPNQLLEYNTHGKSQN